MHGTNGESTIPTEAVAVALNVTAVAATRATDLVVGVRSGRVGRRVDRDAFAAMSRRRGEVTRR